MASASASASALIALLAIYVQQANSLGEGHFIFFISMTLLIRYGDILPLIWATALTLVHHFTLTYCQVAGINLLNQPLQIFSWSGSQLGILEPLIYHLVIAVVSFVISTYYIFDTNRKFLQDNAIVVATRAAFAGNLKVRADNQTRSESVDQTNQLIESIDQPVNACGIISDNLNTKSDELLSSANQRLEQSASQQNKIDMVATAVEETTATTREVAENAENTARLAESTSVNSKKGITTTQQCSGSIEKLTTEVNSASKIIEELDSKGQQIDSIVDTISEIAEQTNLLALNAAIEAARAGEQGRGFAVVADEVRVLSKRTHDSTEEITNMISAFQQVTENAVKIMDRCRNLAEKKC